MSPLRCWARRASDGALCERRRGHVLQNGCGGDHRSKMQRQGCSRVWNDRECAPEAGPDGRETAALRILELSNEIDRRAFLAGEHSTWVSLIRALAARLFVSTRSVDEDLRRIESVLSDWRGRRMPEPQREVFERDEIAATLSLAADILRPFAEGRR